MSAADASVLAPFTVDTHSYTRSHAAGDCVDHLARLGCRSVEFLLAPGHLWPSEIDMGGIGVLRRRLADAGVTVAALNIPNFDVNLGSDYPEMRSYTLDLLEASVRLAGELRAAAFAIGPGRSSPLFPAPRAELAGQLRRALDRLVPAGAAGGVTIAVENVPYSFVPNVGDLLDLLDEFGPEVGFTWDVANSHFIGEALSQAVARAGSRLILVHASDTTRQVHRHDRIGSGDVPFHEVRPTGAPLVLEIITQTPDGDIPASAEALRRAGWGASA